MTSIRSSHFKALLVFLLAAALPGHPVAQETCAPLLPDVYEYRVGDVFQISTGLASSAGGSWPSEQQTRKFTVLSKTTLGKARVYVLKGLYRHASWTSSFPGKNEVSYGEFEETRRVDDSAGHFLNACPGTLVPVPVEDQGDPTLEITSFVRSATGPTKEFPQAPPSWHLKWIGGEGNLFKKTSTGREPVSNLRYLSLYAEGVGPLKWSWDQFETSKYEVLQGLVRSGDTVGTINPDSFFREPASVLRAPAIGMASIKGKLPSSGTWWWQGGPVDLRGRQIRFPDLTGPVPP